MVLVTGGTGFLGSYLIKYLLKEGQAVRATCRSSSSFDLVQEVKDKVDWVVCDILETASLLQALEGIQEVYHCAAIINPDARRKEMMFRVNVTGTANLVNLCLASGVKKLVHVSSISALGRHIDNRPVDESCIWEPSKENSHYSYTKFWAEQEVWRGIAEGLNAVILNPSLILGAGFWQLPTANIFTRVVNNERFYPTGSSGFVDVRDVALACITAMKSTLSEERFIISAENLVYKDFFQKIADSAGAKGPRTALSSTIIRLAVAKEWIESRITGKDQFATLDSLRHTAINTKYKNQKSIERLGIRYRPITETIDETVALLIQAKKENMRPSTLEIS